jgi:hypothetical protein
MVGTVLPRAAPQIQNNAWAYLLLFAHNIHKKQKSKKDSKIHTTSQPANNNKQHHGGNTPQWQR